VVTSSAIPTNLGGGSTEDPVIVYDNGQALLFEDSAMPTFLRFDQPGVGSLSVSLVGYGYAGSPPPATPSRSPGSAPPT
jgi:hypothetical protein